MQRRYLITALALVFALAAITPTLGAQSQQQVVAQADFPVRTAQAAKRIAKRARTIAYGARTAATDALTIAGQAKTSADAAQTSAGEAKTTASGAKATADATTAELAGLRSKTDTDAGTVTTTEENTYVDLGGPSVTVNVPPSGLIQVWAQISTVDGAVSLYEDGQQVPDQDPNDLCSGPGGTAPPSGVLLSAAGLGPPPITISTPGGAALGGFCGSTAAPGAVMLDASPGQHTYELRYASCGCFAPDPAEFADRTLTVAPLP